MTKEAFIAECRLGVEVEETDAQLLARDAHLRSKLTEAQLAELAEHEVVLQLVDGDAGTLGGTYVAGDGTRLHALAGC